MVLNGIGYSRHPAGWRAESGTRRGLVNILTILLTHLLMLVAAWRLMMRDDLDADPPVTDEGESP